MVIFNFFAINILICGNYGATNLGDEAILDGIIFQLKQKHPNAKITVLSYDLKQTEKMHEVQSCYFFPLGFRSFLRTVLGLKIINTIKAYSKSDLFVFGGGGLLTDERFFAVIIWTLHLFAAGFFKKNIHVYATSIGPLNTRFGRFLVKRALKGVKHFSVRDEMSRDLLKELGIEKKIEVVQDPVMSLPFNRFIKEKVSEDPNEETKLTQSTVLFSLRSWKRNRDNLFNVIPKIVDYLIENYNANIVFVPFQQISENDQEFMKFIRRKIRQKEKVKIYNFNPDYKELLPMISDCRLLIGMRLHSVIFAYKLKVPFISLMYSSKIKGFLQSVKKEDRGVELADLTEERLKEMVDREMGL